MKRLGDGHDWTRVRPSIERVAIAVVLFIAAIFILGIIFLLVRGR